MTMMVSRKFTEFEFRFINRENTYTIIIIAKGLLTLQPKRLNNNGKKTPTLTVVGEGGGKASWPAPGSATAEMDIMTE